MLVPGHIELLPALFFRYCVKLFKELKDEIILLNFNTFIVWLINNITGYIKLKK